MPERKCIKAIYFDLDTKALQQYYPSSNWRKAYDDINNFMFEKGFVHKQGSGYETKSKMNSSDISLIAKQISGALPWLADCVREFDVTNISNQYSLVETIKASQSKETIQNRSLSEKNITEKLDEIMDIADKIEEAFENDEVDLNKDECSVGQEH